MDVFFSEDVHAQLQFVLKNDCSDPNSQQCQDGLSSAIDKTGLSPHQLAPRQGIAIILNGLLNYIKIGLHLYGHKGTGSVPAAIHFSPQDLVQMSAVASNTAVVVVTLAGASGTTVSVPARPTKATG